MSPPPPGAVAIVLLIILVWELVLAFYIFVLPRLLKILEDF